MSAAFTPGPWKAYRESGDLVACIHVDRPDDDGMLLAEVFGNADARLIATAPELYDGCNALLGLIQLVLNRDDLTDGVRVALSNSHRIIEAKCALAKARGEQSK